jgi:hypothetical protein
MGQAGAEESDLAQHRQLARDRNVDSLTLRWNGLNVYTHNAPMRPNVLKDVLIGAAVIIMACRILYELKTGKSHLRWGPPSKRDEHPLAFWTNIIIRILAIVVLTPLFG